MIDILKDTKQVRSIYWQFNQQWCHRYDQDLVVSNQFVPASSACQAQQNLAVAESLTTFTVCCAVVQKKNMNEPITQLDTFGNKYIYLFEPKPKVGFLGNKSALSISYLCEYEE